MNWCQARPRDSVFGRVRQEASKNLLMAGRPVICLAPLCGAGAGPPTPCIAAEGRKCIVAEHGAGPAH